MDTDGFTSVDRTSKRTSKRDLKQRQEELQKQFDEEEWPRLCEERAKACKIKYRQAQFQSPEETKKDYEARLTKAVESAMKKFGNKEEKKSMFEAYVLRMSIPSSTLQRSDSKSSAIMKALRDARVTAPSLMSAPTELRVALQTTESTAVPDDVLPLPTESQPPSKPQTKPTPKRTEPLAVSSNSFSALEPSDDEAPTLSEDDEGGTKD